MSTERARVVARSGGRTAMDWSAHDELSARWRAEGRFYVRAINDYVAHRLRGEEVAAPPPDRRGDLLAAVMRVVQEANQAGEIAELRRRFPPGYAPPAPHVERRGAPIGNVVWQGAETIYAALGPPEHRERVVQLHPAGEVRRLRRDLRVVGRSACRAFVGVAFADRIEVHHRGKVVRQLRAPTGFEGVPEDDASWLPSPPSPPHYVDLAIFPRGEAALVVLPEGVFVCREREVTRVFPRGEALWAAAETLPVLRFPGIHAALSPDGALLAVGHQGSAHEVITADGRPYAVVEPGAPGPCHARFSPNGTKLLVGSGQARAGVAVIADVPRTHLRLVGAPDRVQPVQRLFAVHASCFVGDAFVVGDDSGYLRAYGPGGELQWQHFCGAAVTSLDVAPDGTRLAVATAAAHLQIIELDAGERDPYQIGTATHRERLRFLRWGRDELLRW